MKVNITVTGLHKLKAKVSRGAHFLGEDGLRSVLQEEGKGLVDTFRQTINTFTPGPVRDLKQATKEQKAREGWSVYPILVRSGDMVRSMKSLVRHGKRGGWTIAITFKGVDRYGERNDVKARAHLEGTAHLPVRDFTTIPRAWSKNLFSQIRKKLGWK